MSGAGRRWGQLAASAIGLGWAWLVHSALEASSTPMSRPEPVRVAMRVASAAPQTSRPVAAEVLPLKALPAVKKPKVVMPELQEKKTPASLATETPAGLSFPEVISAPAYELVQPSLSVPAKDDAQALPLLSGESSVADTLPPPPIPPEDAFVSMYDDPPNGWVTVIAMLVNHDGDVIDTKVVIPSRFPLQDMTYAMAAKYQKFSQLVPPLAPGETRWLELRFKYPDPTLPLGIVP